VGAKKVYLHPVEPILESFGLPTVTQRTPSLHQLDLGGKGTVLNSIAQETALLVIVKG